MTVALVVIVGFVMVLGIIAAFMSEAKMASEGGFIAALSVSAISTREDVEAFCASNYDMTDNHDGWGNRVGAGINDVMKLLPEHRARIERKPRYMCQISVNGRPCPNPGHIYTEEWHGFATQGTIKKFHCFEHFDSVSYHDNWGGFRSRYLVIGERTAYDGITEAIRARGMNSRSAAAQFMGSSEYARMLSDRPGNNS